MNVDNIPITIGNTVQVEVLRQGEPEQIAVSRMNEGNHFREDENELCLAASNELTFNCSFEISWFPFDFQYCNISTCPSGFENLMASLGDLVEKS